MAKRETRLKTLLKGEAGRPPAGTREFSPAQADDRLEALEARFQPLPI